jgi:acetyltransferase EpsM
MAPVNPSPEATDPGVSAEALVVLGGGEHARAVIEAARTVPGAWRVTGLVDPAPAARTVALTGVPRLGDDAWFAAAHRAATPADRPRLVLGIGVPGGTAARRALVDALGPDAAWAVVIHAGAWVSPSASLAPGAVVLAGAAVNAGAEIGPHAIVNTGAVVEHDVRIGAGAHVGPGAVIGGAAAVGDGAMIGLGALVRDHVTVGADAIVGMGSVVVADVAPGMTVAGNPARELARA